MTRRTEARPIGAALLLVLLVALLAGLLASPLGDRIVSASGIPEAVATGRSVLESVTAPGRADGRIDDDHPISPFADAQPAIARLRPDLRRALQQAARAAARDGVRMVVTGGWRSRRYQAWLLEQAVAEYGGRAAAARLVASPARSEHVQGRAVDVGFTDADDWLQRHGADYGLCRMYANEMWHFELAVRPGGTCPRPWADAAAREAAQR